MINNKRWFNGCSYYCHLCGEEFLTQGELWTHYTKCSKNNTQNDESMTELEDVERKKGGGNVG